MPETAKSWFRFERNEGAAEIFIYDEIGAFGITAQDFVRELRDADAESLTIRINSPGGSVDDGMAIFQAIDEFDGPVETRGDAAVYSIASVLMQAGDKRVMAPRARMMVHEAMAFGMGYAADFERVAKGLKETTNLIAGIYAERSGKEASYWLDKMAAETRMSGQETVNEGLADELAADNDRSAFRVAANFNLTRFKNSDALRAELEAAAHELGTDPIELPETTLHPLEAALEAALAPITAALAEIRAFRESNKGTPELDPRDAARRDLELAIQRVSL